MATRGPLGLAALLPLRAERDRMSALLPFIAMVLMIVGIALGTTD